MDKEKIGGSLKMIREYFKISQSELARTVGIEQSNISRWESGSVYPNIEDLIKLADYYDISLDELVGREFEK